MGEQTGGKEGRKGVGRMEGGRERGGKDGGRKEGGREEAQNQLLLILLRIYLRLIQKCSR